MDRKYSLKIGLFGYFYRPVVWVMRFTLLIEKGVIFTKLTVLNISSETKWVGNCPKQIEFLSE